MSQSAIGYQDEVRRLEIALWASGCKGGACYSYLGYINSSADGTSPPDTQPPNIMNPYWKWLNVFKPDPLQSLYPDVPPLPHKDWSYVANQWLDQVAAGVEKGIRDTHAWKEMVRREGLPQARRLLRRALLADQLPCVNPRN